MRLAGDVADAGRRHADAAARAGGGVRYPPARGDVGGSQEVRPVLVPAGAQPAQPDVPGRRRRRPLWRRRSRREQFLDVAPAQ